MRESPLYSTCVPLGCTTHVKNVGMEHTKLADRSKKMVMIGYETGDRVNRATTCMIQRARSWLSREM